MSVYDVTYKTVVHANPVISNESEMGEYSLPNTVMEMVRYSLLNLSSINMEI